MNSIDNLKVPSISYESLGLLLHEAIDKNQVAILTLEVLRNQISKNLDLRHYPETTRLLLGLEEAIKESGLFVQDAKRKLSTKR